MKIVSKNAAAVVIAGMMNVPTLVLAIQPTTKPHVGTPSLQQQTVRAPAQQIIRRTLTDDPQPHGKEAAHEQPLRQIAPLSAEKEKEALEAEEVDAKEIDKSFEEANLYLQRAAQASHLGEREPNSLEPTSVENIRPKAD